MKKNKITFEQNKRQIELLEKYYTLDKENKVISITLHYEKASELLAKNIGNTKHFIFSQEVLEKIDGIIQNIPAGYKVAINFEIGDYEGYNPKELIESFNDTLELAQYDSRRQRQRKELLCAILVLVGIILLFIMASGKGNGWFGSGIKEDIIEEIIDIAAWVFVWEAVSIFFLEHSKEAIFSLKIRRMVTKISMYEKNNLIPPTCEKADDVFGKWENEEKIKKVGKYFLLISSVAFIFMSFYSFYDLYRILSSQNYSLLKVSMYAFVTIVYFIISFMAGLGGISRFLGKNEKLGKFVGPYAIFLSIVICFAVVVTLIIGDWKSIFSIISSLVINIFYVVGFYIDRYVK